MKKHIIFISVFEKNKLMNLRIIYIKHIIISLLIGKLINYLIFNIDFYGRR